MDEEWGKTVLSNIATRRLFVDWNCEMCCEESDDQWLLVERTYET